MGHAMQKSVFGQMRTVKAQISLRIRAVWSVPSLTLSESLGTVECMNGEQRPGWYCVHVQDDLNLRILHMFEDFLVFFFFFFFYLVQPK